MLKSHLTFSVVVKCLFLSTLVGVLLFYAYSSNITNNFTTPWRLKTTNNLRDSKEGFVLWFLSKVLEFRSTHKNPTCTNVKHIFYLKVHKTGSTTLTCMLYRYGIKNDLIFASFKHHHPYPALDMSQYVLPHPLDLQSGIDFGHKRDIMNKHSVFNATAVYKFMPNDTVFIATVRHPLAQLKSAFNHYNLPKLLNIPETVDDPVSVFLSNPAKYDRPLPASLYNIIAREHKIEVSFTKNRMAFEFGFNLERASMDEEYIQSYVAYLGKTFKHVIITEYYDESLLLLKEKLCWSYKNILYLPLRKQHYKDKELKPELYGTLYNNHKNWANLDYLLYDYFLNLYKTEVDSRGEQFAKEVKYFKTILGRVRNFCTVVCNVIYSDTFQLLLNSSNFTTASQMLSDTLIIDENEYHDLFSVTAPDCVLYMFDEKFTETRVSAFQYAVQLEPNVAPEEIFQKIFRLSDIIPKNILYRCEE